MSVDKMKRYHEAAKADQARRDRTAWLARQEPAHRQHHERYPGAPCGVCLQRASASAGRGIAQAMARMTKA